MTNEPRSTSGPVPLLDRFLKQFSKVPQDQESLIDIVRLAEENNIVEPDTMAMMEGALQVSNMRVNEIMVPRVQIVTIHQDATQDEILASVIESGHSRFPVIADNKNQVVGILLAKDLLSFFAKGNESEDFDIKSMIRPTVYVPESKRLNVLLREFRQDRNHMAIVVDEYGGIAGLVTIEDVIEEIVGEIEDEHDIEEEETIIQHSKNRYTVKAITNVDEFNQFFGSEFDDSEFDTMGGLVMNAFGHVPKRGETIELEGFSIRILRSDKRRIQFMRFIRIDTPTVTEEPAKT